MPIGELLTTLAALSAVLLLAVGAGRALRWGGLARLPGRSTHPYPIAIRATLSLDPKRRLFLVSCNDRIAVVLTGPSGDTFLGWQDEAVRPDSPMAADGR